MLKGHIQWRNTTEERKIYKIKPKQLRNWQPVQFSCSLVSDSLQLTPWIAAHQASLSTNSRSSLRFTSIDSVMPSSQLILCCILLLLSSIFPSIRIFSNESVLPIMWPKYWSFSFSISPSNEYSGLISFRFDWISLQSKGLSRVFSNITVQKHQFFSTHLSLWCNSHIHTWPLEKPKPGSDGPLLAKQCLCFF